VPPSLRACALVLVCTVQACRSGPVVSRGVQPTDGEVAQTTAQSRVGPHGSAAARPSAAVLQAAASAFARHRGRIRKPQVWTVVDYDLPSSTARLWVLDHADGDRVLFHTRTAHAVASDDPTTHTVRSCSNVVQSQQTSAGAFATAGATYHGKWGLSLRLHGLDHGVNDKAMARNVVLHTDRWPDGRRLSMTSGCLTVPIEAAPQILDALQGGTFLYVSARRCTPPSTGAVTGGAS
jgi:hypothetical protein